MVKIYLLKGASSDDKAWQHEYGRRLCDYAGTLHGNERLIYSNISHSGCFVVAALSDFPVGVDIEYIRPVRDIGRKFLTEAEQLWVSENKRSSLLRMWTIKESYGKAYRFGIAYPMKKTEFIEKTAVCGWSCFSCTDSSVTVFNKEEKEYTISVCIRNSRELPELTVLQTEKIL